MYHRNGHITFPLTPYCANDSFQETVGYLERHYNDILAEESPIIRNARFRDNRVHALLYFIPPTGHAYVPFRFVVPL
jgi:septin family protein